MDALNDDKDKVRLMSSNPREEDPRPRSESGLSDRTLLNMSDSDPDEKRRSGDLEKEGLVEQLPKVVAKEHATKDPYARAKILMWMFVNTVATVTIVSYYFLCMEVPEGPSSVHQSNTRRPTIAIYQSILTAIFFIRSSVTKPFSATNLSHNVKQHSQPSTSSLQQRPSTYSLVPQSACSSLGRFPS